MGSSERAVMGLGSQAQVTKNFVIIFSKTCNKLQNSIAAILISTLIHCWVIF